ncbi:MAG TPA: sulfotransferase family protein [Candidatus Hydrogenedentes bacterium]|nr:sulfotransferase family protein [Candidatus Hydrogenedentota bacterium]
MENNAREFITVVSGLPRSGTSMAMRMLEAGGMPILTDRIRRPDDDNPKGYYEFERVKRLKEDKAWLPDAVGKAVKIISFLLPELPHTHSCRIVFLRRAMPEVLASQRHMLIRRGESAEADDDAQMAQVYAKHLKQVEAWIAAQPWVQALYLEHRAIIDHPAAAATAMNAFLGGGLDAAAMAASVDATLYRQRA